MSYTNNRSKGFPLCAHILQVQFWLFCLCPIQKLLLRNVVFIVSNCQMKCTLMQLPRTPQQLQYIASSKTHLKNILAKQEHAYQTHSSTVAVNFAWANTSQTPLRKCKNLVYIVIDVLRFSTHAHSLTLLLSNTLPLKHAAAYQWLQHSSTARGSLSYSPSMPLPRHRLRALKLRSTEVGSLPDCSGVESSTSNT